MSPWDGSRCEDTPAAYSPTVVDGHQVGHQDEGIRQHAGEELEESGSRSVPACRGPDGPWNTYPGHSLGAVPDFTCVAHLHRRTTAGVMVHPDKGTMVADLPTRRWRTC